METSEMQELLLATMPLWHCKIAKPFRKLLDEGISLEMYYCIQVLRHHQGGMTMTELAKSVHSPKQQMTKVVSKLIDMDLAQRVNDPKDRRLIRLELTEQGLQYMDHFLQKDAVYYRNMLDAMSAEDRKEFGEALTVLYRVLSKTHQKDAIGSLQNERI